MVFACFAANTEWRGPNWRSNGACATNCFFSHESIALLVISSRQLIYRRRKILNFPLFFVSNAFVLSMQHNAEPEAVDLLMEVPHNIFSFFWFLIWVSSLLFLLSLKHMVYTQLQVEDLDLLVEHVDNTNFRRTCLYLTSAAR